ncbi:Dyp-type peroxidase [Novosphingobium lentum]|uniref:Dyp-type peroxidase n=1 Tax=Novosphingobium lentum TaxID=145287 RepID=UPI00082AB652|nr:hypothetical protein [Novosphingobium lentum]
MAASDQAADIQAMTERGFGSLDGASYLLLSIDDAARARTWLRTLAVTSLADARSSKLDRVCQIAFTASGLAALGIAADAAHGFAPEFAEGMAGNERRSHRLGDEGENAPDKWYWGVADTEPHVLVVLLAPVAAIAAVEAEHVAALTGAGCALIRANRSNGPLGREPFGFADGLSQPEVDWDGQLVPGGAKDRLYRNTLAAGEVLLGHTNEYGFVPAWPSEREIGRNGTYLVYRQLEQDVHGFWRWLREQAGKAGAVGLGETMIGRGIDGAPQPGLGGAAGPGANDFGFGQDPDGLACPIGAHIRRANPRSGDDPQGRRGFLRDVISSLGLKGSAMQDAVASARFHRILRRGRPYGPIGLPAGAGDDPPTPVEPSGLHFICLNASIARQFEFVQGAWVASAYFAGLSGEQDPILGNRLPASGGGATDAFHYADAEGCPRLATGLPQFVTVRGGAYFFLPGLAGLAQILAG